MSINFEHEALQRDNNVMGIMNSGKFAVNNKIGYLKKQTVIKTLKAAKNTGYDSCIITRGGIYGTKKL